MQSPVRPPYSVFIWAAVAALALGLFAAMSLLALGSGGLDTLRGASTPTQELPEISTPGLSSSLSGTPAPLTTATPTASTDPTALVGLWLSAISAITALIGLVSSLWLGWRKEGREAAQRRLELEKARLEIRKLQQELAADSSGSSEPAG